MCVQSNSANDLIPLPISDVDELQCLNGAEIEIWWWLIQLSAREELRLASGMLLALVEGSESLPFILRHFLEVVRVMEDIEVVNDVELLVAHLEDVKKCWSSLLTLLQLNDRNQVWILCTLPHPDSSVSESDQNDAYRVLEWEADARHADHVVRVEYRIDVVEVKAFLLHDYIRIQLLMVGLPRSRIGVEVVAFPNVGDFGVVCIHLLALDEAADEESAMIRSTSKVLIVLTELSTGKLLASLPIDRKLEAMLDTESGK